MYPLSICNVYMYVCVYFSIVSINFCHRNSTESSPKSKSRRNRTTRHTSNISSIRHSTQSLSPCVPQLYYLRQVDLCPSLVTSLFPFLSLFLFFSHSLNHNYNTVSIALFTTTTTIMTQQSSSIKRRSHLNRYASDDSPRPRRTPPSCCRNAQRPPAHSSLPPTK